MASALYPKFLEALLTGAVGDLTTANVKAVLIDAADEVYNAADQFYSDITAAGIVGTPTALTGKTVTNGVFDAADTTITAVTGDPTEAVLLFVDTGTPTTSRLIGMFDGTFTPNGSNCLITWPNDANRIFAL